MVINKNILNTVCLKLKALSSLSTPYYLFHFYNAFDEGNEIFFNATDLSAFNCSYNLFDIIESGTSFVNLTASTPSIYLFPLESWNYNIYEATASTLSISATTCVVLNTGKVIVVNNSGFNTLDSIYL